MAHTTNRQAQRILGQMLTTADKQGWKRILDALLDLFAAWTQGR